MTFKEFIKLAEEKEDPNRFKGGTVKDQDAELRKQGLKLSTKTWGAKDSTRRQQRQKSKADLKKQF